jgi:ParB family transcriptional regulator, chromosome partitioning protein
MRIMTGETKEIKNCGECEFWRSRDNKRKGVGIPNGTGKCARPEGHCDPDVTKGGIGEGPQKQEDDTTPEPPVLSGGNFQEGGGAPDAPRFEWIPVNHITRSTNNARKKFDGKEFDDLVESIRTQGVIQPILIRPLDYASGDNEQVKYRIVAGERRWRAMKKVGIIGAKIPAIIREMDDDQAFELMTIENLHREGLSPLEEAESFKAYLERKGPEFIDHLAEKVGKHPGYIRRRVRVMNLAPEILAAWESGEIVYGHCEQLIRLEASDAAEVFRKEIQDRPSWEGPVTVSDLKMTIDVFQPQLESARFDTGACQNCPDSSALQLKLFDMAGDAKPGCANRECFERKTVEYLDREAFTPEILEETGVAGWRFELDINVSDSNDYCMSLKKGCAGCEKLVAVVDFYGEVQMDKVCLDQKCFRKTTADTGTKEEKQEARQKEKSREHGVTFRDEFYETAIPERMSSMEPGDIRLFRAHVFCGIRTRNGMRRWLMERLTGKEGDWMDIGHKDILEWTLSSSLLDLQEAQLEMVSVELFDPVSRHGYTYYHEDRVCVARLLEIDLKKEWRITKGYLEVKTIPEIKAIAERFVIFETKDARAFLYETLGKKRDKFNSCNKNELIRIFLESGADLAGVVPDEILNTGMDI